MKLECLDYNRSLRGFFKIIPRASAVSMNSLTTFHHVFLNRFFATISSVCFSIRDIRSSSILDTTPPFWIRRFEALARSFRACWAAVEAARSRRTSLKRCAYVIDLFISLLRVSRDSLFKASRLRSFSLIFLNQSAVFGVLLVESPLKTSSGGGVAIKSSSFSITSRGLYGTIPVSLNPWQIVRFLKVFRRIISKAWRNSIFVNLPMLVYIALAIALLC